MWNSGEFDHRWPIRIRRPMDVAIRCVAMQTVANGSGGLLVALFAAASASQNVVAGGRLYHTPTFSSGLNSEDTQSDRLRHCLPMGDEKSPAPIRLARARIDYAAKGFVPEHEGGLPPRGHLPSTISVSVSQTRTAIASRRIEPLLTSGSGTSASRALRGLRGSTMMAFIAASPELAGELCVRFPRLQKVA
jgi:hypothetical protein